MSKAYRAKGGGDEQVKPPKEAKQSPLEGQHSNELMVAMMSLVAQSEEETSYFQLALQADVDVGKYDFAEDDGKYDFAEDDDKERKQQDEKLPELREKHSDKKYEDYANGQAFLKGKDDAHEVDPNDVNQGALGDCYLMAGMAAVARANPDLIKNLIKDNGDGTFDVTLYMRENSWTDPKPVTKTIDGRLASKVAGRPLYAKQGDKEDGKEELWAALLEKTVAQHKGSYEKISGSNISKDGFEFHGASELFTGKKEGYMRTDGLDEDDALLHIAIALEEKKPVTCDSKNMKDDPELTKEATAVNVYGNHAYPPVSVDLDKRTLDLQNPWGSSHVDDLPVKDFLRYYRSIRIGA